jgi:para-aminobenzoate synthetase/4-amino-4-deoxychorismate lyase
VSEAGQCLVHHARQGVWWRFRRPLAVFSADRPEAVLPALAAAEAAVEGRGLYAAGFLAYGAAAAFDPALAVRGGSAVPLLWLGLYDHPEPVPLPVPGAAEEGLVWSPTISRPAYREALRRIRGWIGEGDSYQVNFTYRLRADFRGDPMGLFGRLVRAQAPGYAAYVDTGRFAVCSASPELFLERTGERVLSRPMKGTRGRAPTLASDRAEAEALRASPKDLAENVMIVDMVRNDLGRVARPGSVRVPRRFAVERYPTVWQMVSDVEALTGASTAEVLAATFPPASVTGAPKARTMAIIRELEDSPRGVYTGAVGFLAPGRQCQLNVAIRTVVVDRETGLAEYGVGGGVVWDSRAEEEWAESRAKARVLTAAAPTFELLETLRWDPSSGYFLLEAHLRRLDESAEYFGFRSDRDAVTQDLQRAAAGFVPVPQRVRLRVAADGGRTLEWQPLHPREAGRPYRVALAAGPVDVADRFLYHKTTWRRVYDQARAARPDADDVLLWNARGELTESCTANLVVVLDGRRYTPPVRCGLLAGTYRAWLLEQGQVEERVITREDLARVERVALVNSVRGEWVVELADPPGFRLSPE